MNAGGFQGRIVAVRRFNRFYTKKIGVLNEGLLNSPFSLAEARVIYQLAHPGETTATDLCGELDLDGGYLSRMLRRFKSAGLIHKRRSGIDGRQHLLSLTVKGKVAFATLDARSRDRIGAILSHLSATDQSHLVGAMHAIEDILGAGPEPKTPFLLRPHQPGDMGWVVHRHGVLYAEAYGWDETFEALVAGIVAGFIDNYRPLLERCWIAEMAGETVGSVFLVRHSDTEARLRLLLIEPKARGQGLGSRLVRECERFARRAGYRKIRLWTNDVLTAARHIYRKAGYRLVETEPHHSFGRDLVGETWELDLAAPSRPENTERMMD